MSPSIDPEAEHSAHAGGSEILFDFADLFFSRTDERGVILFGNEVFQRVSVYGWDELLGKPHKIVRHPDTPRAVFWLLWDSLKRGEPIGAYVCNRAKDGRYYWVFALVTPIDGGYLSVRLRPSSAILAKAKTLYSELIDKERTARLEPAESAKVLVDALRQGGYDSYAAFMSAALGAEMASRDAVLSHGRPGQTDTAIFDDLQQSATSLLQQTDIIGEAYARNEHVPMNFQVLAAQLGRDGTAIGVVSSNYSVLSAEIRESLTRFRESAVSVLDTIYQGQFLAHTARLQREVCGQFESEHAADAAAKHREVRLLLKQQAGYRARSIQGLRDIAMQASRFQAICGELSRLAAGLEVTRIMGKVECARHTAFRDSLNELLDDLETFQKIISQCLKEMNARNLSIQHRTERLLASAA